MATEHVVPFGVREHLYERLRQHARFAADFECSAGNYDRPIAETPWLAENRYGTDKYDARWYAVHSAQDRFIEGLMGAIDDTLAEIERAAYAMGTLAASPSTEGAQG